jgi:hypothetical protein
LPAGRLAVEIPSAELATVRLKSLDPVEGVTSVTWMVKAKEPVVEGTPLKTPTVDRESPSGRTLPGWTDQM